ncbi:hypothetical protein [Rhodopseudomonas sp. B29]|uniref:hypothetical protein n=1 Tax=Rhodopseudomonas sp. B29 TaxID=95607 RepID=UPI0009FD16CD|nr:hypothetical protein [Rhodopseudomonas sp. B29]
MNRVVRNYPASRLPEDLREGVDTSSTVTVWIVEDEKPPERVMTLEEIFSVQGFRRRTAEEITEDLRRQRQEWDS